MPQQRTTSTALAMADHQRMVNGIVQRGVPWVLIHLSQEEHVLSVLFFSDRHCSDTILLVPRPIPGPEMLWELRLD